METSTEKKIVYTPELAKKYNEYHGQDNNLFRLQVSKIKSYLDLNKDSVVYDAGSGAGRLAEPIGQAVRHVFGVELSPAMAQEARDKTAGLPVTIINQSWVDFVNEWDITKAYLYPKADAIYYSMSLHQMGTKEEQIKILSRSLDLIKQDGKILLITVSGNQFEEILLNKFFPTVDKIDKARFLDIDELKVFNVVSTEEHTVYKRYPKQVFFDMIAARYISSLQLISDEEFSNGLANMEEYYLNTDLIIAPDCYTYVVIEQ